MPYITKEEKHYFDADIELMLRLIKTPGQLNYIFTKLLHGYINSNELRYKTINEAIGVLECCKLELYRRIAAPYEDSCIMKNGDVNDVNFENKKA